MLRAVQRGPPNLETGDCRTLYGLSPPGQLLDWERRVWNVLACEAEPGIETPVES